MKLRWTKYSRAELKDRRRKFRSLPHRCFAWLPVIVTDEKGGRKRSIYWLRWFDRRCMGFYAESWSNNPAKDGTQRLEEMVRSSQRAPYI